MHDESAAVTSGKKFNAQGSGGGSRSKKSTTVSDRLTGNLNLCRVAASQAIDCTK
jgi:hypothetical protein